MLTDLGLSHGKWFAYPKLMQKNLYAVQATTENVCYFDSFRVWDAESALSALSAVCWLLEANSLVQEWDSWVKK